MACRYLSDNIVLLDHKTFVDGIYSSYRFYDAEITSASLRSELFHVVVPYDVKPNDDQAESASKSRKRKRIAEDFDQTTLKVKERHAEFLGLFGKSDKADETSNNTALEFVDQFNRNDHYDPETVLKGGNNSQFVVTTTVSNEHYFIPPNCRFFNSDVRHLSNLLTCDDKFDFIVLDPPWWNKYIRRTKAANKKMGYSMLDNECLKNIPLENYIHDKTIVAIWCTNSPTHTSAIELQLCTKWNLKLVTTWYWTKITKFGQPVCSFNESTKKQPYERLFIAVSNKYPDKDNIALENYIYSVPCAIHSNKPPLLELFADLLPERPKCLELFARNVYPNYTSIGTEVLKLQNARLFHLSKHERYVLLSLSSDQKKMMSMSMIDRPSVATPVLPDQLKLHQCIKLVTLYAGRKEWKECVDVMLALKEAKSLLHSHEKSMGCWKYGVGLPTGFVLVNGTLDSSDVS